MIRSRYEVIEHLGSGAMGSVYRVEDRLAGAEVALKALWTDGDDAPLVAALRAEFGVLAHLRHPLLCRVFDFGRLPRDCGAPGAPPGASGLFLTRELADGISLDRAAAECGRDWSQIARWLAAAARGLEVLHQGGVRHGDLKPANIIVSADGPVRLIDFGLAVAERSSRQAGTLPYMAPEVLAGRAPDRRADLYALGVALFELVSGQLPSGELRGSELVAWHRGSARPRLVEGVASVPAVLSDLASRLMAPVVDDRVASAAEVAFALDACADGAGTAPLSDRASDEFVMPSVVRTGIAELERALERRRARRGGPALIEVVGEAGSGRSALLTEFSWRAELSGAEVVRGDPQAAMRPLGAFGVALEQLASLSGRPLPPADPSGPLAARGAAVARWLGEVCQAWPAVVLLDDLDDADASTSELARYLAHGLPADTRFLIVGARRGAAVPEATLVSSEVPQVPLSALSLAEIDSLVTRACGRRDPRLSSKIGAHTGGNLLHVVHTMQALHRRNFPAADQLAIVDLPERLEASLESELAAANDDVRAVLEGLSILGGATDLAVVKEMVGVGPEVRISHRLLVLDPAGRARLARLAVGEYLYRQIPSERRARLHASAAALPGLHLPVRVRHWVRAGDVDEVRGGIDGALDELIAAGDRSAALALGREALALMTGSSALDLRARLVELARLAGDLAGAGELASVIIDGPEAGSEEGRRRCARVCLELGRASDSGGEVDRAEALFRRVVEGDSGVVADAAARELSGLYIRRGRFADALEVVDRALECDVDSGDRVHLMIARAFARGSMGVDPQAEQELKAVAETAAAEGNQPVLAAALHYAARIAFSAGDYRGAHDQYSRALAAAESCGDVARVGVLRMNLAAMDFSFGDLAGSKRHYLAAVSYLRAARLSTFEVLARRNFGHLLLEIGESERARAELGVARKSARDIGLPVHDIGIGALLGLIAWRSGDLATARKELERARRGFEELGDARRCAETLLDLAELELDAAQVDPSRLDDAEVILKECGAIAATTEDTARRGRFLVLSAIVAARRSDRARAAQLVRDTGPVFEELSKQRARQLEWDLHRLLAMAHELAGESVEAASHRRRALSILAATATDLSDAERIAFWQDPRRRWLRAARVSTDHLDVRPTESTVLGSSAPAVIVERLYQLLAIYHRMSSERQLDRLLELVMDSAVELTWAERGFLLLDDGDGGELRTAVIRNLPAAAAGALESAGAAVLSADVPYSRSVAQKVFDTGDPVVTADAVSDPRFDAAKSVHALHLGSVVCIPVHARGRIIGVLYLEGNARRRPFSEDDLRLLRAFGDQVAVVLQDAQLMRENQARSRALEEARREIESLLAERTELLEQRTAELAVARRDLAEVNRRFLGAAGAFGLVGRSPAMEKVFQVIDKLAGTDIPVLLLGESGTGKELIARALHAYGARRDRRMVSVNCGALPENILESELFGHVRGAFTGADKDRRGLFEAADGGTLFLDEVGETPPRMQASLLRVLQEGIVRRVGDTADVTVDVRIVAATNRDLEALVEAGQFRKDLFYRLHVVPLRVPALRERIDDIPLLLDHFLQRIATETGRGKLGITQRALALLMDQSWPGNVRQLEHALTSAVVMADNNVLDCEDFDSLLTSTPAPPPPIAAVRARGPGDRQRDERESILQALEDSGWNKSKAAKLLGIPRRTFYRRLREHDIS